MRTLYKLVDKLNGKVYIGSTTDIRCRMIQYKGGNPARNAEIFKRIREIGFDNFEAFELASGPDDVILNMETEAIKNNDSIWPRGYNMCKRSVGCPSGELHWAAKRGFKYRPLKVFDKTFNNPYEAAEFLNISVAAVRGRLAMGTKGFIWL